MFCACLAIILCVVVLIAGATVSVLDIRKYDFGLYYALMAIVGLTAAIAVCVIRPRHGCCTRDPRWYTKCCDRLNRCLIAEQHRVAMAKAAAGVRDGNTASNGGVDGDKRSGGLSNLARQQRATLIMLRPAMELMQHMLHGLVTGDDDDDDGEACGGGGNKDDEDTSDVTTDDAEAGADGSKHRRRKTKKKQRKKLLLPANDACLYTILETSMADTVTMVQPTEVTSVVTVHESYPQLLNDSVPSSPAATLLSPTSLSTSSGRAQLIFAQRRHLSNQALASSDSPRMRIFPDGQNVFTFQRHDILSEPLDEERFSDSRCSSTHDAAGGGEIVCGASS